jgi:hypothetical protein
MIILYNGRAVCFESIMNGIFNHLDEFQANAMTTVSLEVTPCSCLDVKNFLTHETATRIKNEGSPNQLGINTFSSTAQLLI